MHVLYANLFPEKWCKLYTVVYMRLNYSALRVYGLLVQLYTNPSPVVCARCPRRAVHARPADWSGPRIFWYKWAVPKYFGRMGPWLR